MPDIFLSIVIPTYNRAGYIHKTVASLLAQSDTDFEIIVVDDGSTDNTDVVMRPFISDKVQYHKKQNAERGAARNYGARLAQGRYVNFFDSDDLAYDNHVAQARKAVTSLHAPEVIHLAYDIKDADGKFMRKVDTLPPRINDLLIDGNHLSCNGVLLRRDIALQHPFSENRALSASEDYALWMRLACRYTIHSWNVVTSTVVNHEQRSVLTINHDRFMQRMDLLRQEIGNDTAFRDHYGNQWNTFLAYQYIYIALHLAMANYSRVTCVGYLWKAFTHRPTSILTRRFLGALKNIIV